MITRPRIQVVITFFFGSVEVHCTVPLKSKFTTPRLISCEKRLLSHETLKHIFWNKLQAVSLVFFFKELF